MFNAILNRHLVWWGLAIWMTSAQAWGHGDAHVLILDINRQLEIRPKDAALWLRRGELYRLDGNWTNAIRDIDRARTLDPKLDLALLERGRVHFDAGQPSQATNHLTQFLTRHPSNSVALLVRARSLVWLGDHRNAIRDFSDAIRYSPDSGPDMYLERAAACRSLGVGGLGEAISGLEEGLKMLGPILTLQIAAIDYELELKRWDSALMRLDKILENAPRKDRWLMRRAEILLLAGRDAEARENWKRARTEFEALPERMRTTRAGLQQAARFQEVLGVVETPSK